MINEIEIDQLPDIPGLNNGEVRPTRNAPSDAPVWLYVRNGVVPGTHEQDLVATYKFMDGTWRLFFVDEHEQLLTWTAGTSPGVWCLSIFDTLPSSLYRVTEMVAREMEE